MTSHAVEGRAITFFTLRGVSKDEESGKEYPMNSFNAGVARHQSLWRRGIDRTKSNLFGLVAGISIALMPVEIHAQDNYTFKKVLDSKIGDPAFIYKLHACLKFDMAMARVDRSKSGGRSVLLNEKGEQALAKAYIKTFGTSMEEYERIESSRTTVAFSKEFFNPKGKHSFEENFNVCKGVFVELLKEGDSQGERGNQSGGKERTRKENNSHEQCLQAKDYEGCMRFNARDANKESQNDECEDGICFVRAKGRDAYGLPKPVGWAYLEADDGRIFYFSKVYRVPHNEQRSRYIAVQRITRYYQSPKGGTSGAIIGGGSASTSCYGSGTSINCTTTGSSPTYIPGSSPIPGGIISSDFSTVYDCEDNTVASYEKGKLSVLGWRKDPRDWFGRYLRAICGKGEAYRQGLDPLTIRM